MKLSVRIALVSCLGALLSVAITGGLLIRQIRTYSQEQLLQRQTLLVQNRAYALGDSLNIAARELTRLSLMAEIDLTDNDLRPEATLLAHAHRNSTLFNIGLEIEDASGRCLWSEPASEACRGRSYAGTPWFEMGRLASGPVIMSERSDRQLTVIDLVVPIRHRPGAADGVLRGIIDLRSDRIVSPSMTEALPSGTEAALVAQSGDLVYPAQLDRTPGWDVALAAAPQRPAGAFVREEAGELFLYAHAPVAHTTWGLTFRWPYRLLDVSLERQASLLLLILALGGLLAVAVGYASSRFLTRPIGELLEAVRALVTARTSGEAPPACALQAVGRADELGELARAFEQLRSGLAEGDALHRQDLERIRELASSLEDRVRERTAELEAAQRSLVAQERLAAMGRAAAVISHELKNSLNAVGMGFELVALEANRLPHLARVNAQVRAEVDRLRTLTDELLVFARVPRLQTAPADLNDMVRRTALFCAEQALTAGVSIEQKLTGDGAPLAVPCDTKLIGSVLLNLVQNAIEAVAWTAAEDAPRKVVVSTDATWGSDGSGFALFAVEDTGPGVAAEVRPHLFEPFFTTKRNGTGLGLATAQRFASAHGGHIDLESSKLGGARFVVRLPVRQPHGPPKAAA